MDLEMYQQMLNLLHWINEHANQQVSAAMLSEQLHMSPATFSRAFFKITGQRFPDYMNEIRIKSTIHDLVNTDKSVTQLALDNGFRSASAFSRVFMSREGCSPSEYRKKNRSAASDIREEIREILIEVPSGKAQKWYKIWNEAINVGEARFLLQGTFRSQLAHARKKLGFSYVRIWDLFCEEIFPMQPVGQAGMVFRGVDYIMDYIVRECRLIPWIDFGKTREMLLKDIDHIDELIAMAEKAYPAWYDIRMIQNLVRHWQHRYGADELARWRFDLYFEDIAVERVTDRVLRRYIEKYLELRDWMHRSIPGVKVGAFSKPVMSRPDIVRQLLRMWPAEQPPDYISLFCFPYRFRDGMRLKCILRDPAWTKACMHEMLQTLDTYRMEDVPAVITQWNVTFTHRNALNDSCAKAAILLANMETTLDLRSPVIPYELSDLSCAKGIEAEAVFGGSGFLTVDGFEKPVFTALSMMRQMPEYVAAHGEGYLAATDRMGRYDLLLWHAGSFPDSYFDRMEDEVTSDYVLDELAENNCLRHITAKLPAVETGTYSVRIQHLKAAGNELLGALRAFGNLSEPDRDDIDYLYHAAQPERHVYQTASEEGVLTVDITLAPFDLCCLSIRPYRV